ncbi:MAG: DMT family transporter [Rhodospirillales bacterium]|nr:DMT family transporter [Rhodospirillales bacterium]
MLALVVLFWGLNWPIMKLGLQYVTPIWFAATRMFLGAICLFLFLALQGKVTRFSRHELPIVFIVSFFQIALPASLIHTGLSYLEAGRSAILVFTMPLWVAPMAVLFLGERLTKTNLAGLFFGLGGIAVMFNPLIFDITDRNALIGNGLMILASFSFALAIILIRRHSWTRPIIQFIPWQMLLGSGLLVVAATVIEGPPNFTWSPELIAIMAYNGPIASGFAFWAYVSVSSNLSAMSTSLGSMGIPVLGVTSSTVLLGESLSLTMILGLSLISIGVLAVTIRDLKQLRSA